MRNGPRVTSKRPSGNRWEPVRGAKDAGRVLYGHCQQAIAIRQAQAAAAAGREQEPIAHRRVLRRRREPYPDSPRMNLAIDVVEAAIDCSRDHYPPPRQQLRTPRSQSQLQNRGESG